MATDILYSLRNDNSQASIYERILKELEEGRIKSENITLNVPEAIEVLKDNEKKTYFDSFFYEINRLLLENERISNNEQLFSHDVYGNKIEGQIKFDKNIYLINEEVLINEMCKLIEKIGLELELRKKEGAELKPKFIEHKDKQKEKKFVNEDRLQQVIEDAKSKEKNINLIYDDVEIKKLLDETEQLYKNNVDNFNTEDILGPKQDYIDSSPVIGKKTKKQIEHGNIFLIMITNYSENK